MGYRHYFLKVKNEDIDKVKDLSLKELQEQFGDKEEENFVSIHDLIEQECVFEFGKLYWDDTADRIYSKGVPLFTDEEAKEYFSHYSPYVMGKEAVIEAVEIYQGKVKKWLESLLNDDGKEFLKEKKSNIWDLEKKHFDVDRLAKSAGDKLLEWTLNSPVDLSEDNQCVTSSWLYEYSIFNLVHILKTIDWETESLLFYGW